MIALAAYLVGTLGTSLHAHAGNGWQPHFHLTPGEHAHCGADAEAHTRRCGGRPHQHRHGGGHSHAHGHDHKHGHSDHNQGGHDDQQSRKRPCGQQLAGTTSGDHDADAVYAADAGPATPVQKSLADHDGSLLAWAAVASASPVAINSRELPSQFSESINDAAPSCALYLTLRTLRL